ncbi:MAG TPA: hypothetical protein VK578_22725 [Edaphobacter sp.]|nr:hypothetical protein [Edaphobacter sp.]
MRERFFEGIGESTGILGGLVGSDELGDVIFDALHLAGGALIVAGEMRGGALKEKRP